MPIFEVRPKKTEDDMWSVTESKGTHPWRIRAKDEAHVRTIIRRIDTLAVRVNHIAERSPWDDEMFSEIRRIHEASTLGEGPDEIIEPATKEAYRAQIYGD